MTDTIHKAHLWSEAHVCTHQLGYNLMANNDDDNDAEEQALIELWCIIKHVIDSLKNKIAPRRKHSS